jgi:hypothetical protein
MATGRIFQVMFYKFWVDNLDLSKEVCRIAAMYIITTYSCSYTFNPLFIACVKDHVSNPYTKEGKITGHFPYCL